MSAVGISGPVGIAIFGLVNAVVYAAPVFAFLMIVRLLKRRRLLINFQHNDDIKLVLQNYAGNYGDLRTRAQCARARPEKIGEILGAAASGAKRSVVVSGIPSYLSAWRIAATA